MGSLSDTITTPDGVCHVHLFTPGGRDSRGPWPGVVMYPDAGGARAAFHPEAAHLADMGYAVLLPDIYYRHGEFAPFDMATAYSDPKERERIMAMIDSITFDMMAADAAAFFDYLAGRPEVRGATYGLFGYCTGGRNALVVAGRQPDRVAAAAALHPGNLVTDSPDSPHRLADKIRAAVYVAGAQNDNNFPAEQAARFEQALTAAGVEHTVEIYPARHGFAVPDNPAYDEAAVERQWAALRDLFAANVTS